MKFYDGESEEELDIEKENEKIRQKLFEDLGYKEEDSSSYSKTNDLVKSFKVQSKINKIQSDNKPKSSPINQNISDKINSLQKELDTVSQEIQDYVIFYNGNKVIKEAQNFDNLLKELDSYSNKLKNIMSSEVYQNSLYKNILPQDKANLKNEIKTNLNNYSISTKKLFDYIANEKDNYINQNDVSTTSHEIIFSKDITENLDDNLNIDNEINELEKQIENVENIVGKRQLNSNKEISLTKSIGVIIKLADKFQNNKDNVLKELNEILDDLGKEKNYGTELGNFFIKIRELFMIYQIYLSYDDIVKYLKNRIQAIIEINDCGKNFNIELDFLKKMILENENKYKKMNEKYNETFVEMGKLEDVLKDLKELEKYFANYFV